MAALKEIEHIKEWHVGVHDWKAADLQIHDGYLVCGVEFDEGFDQQHPQYILTRFAIDRHPTIPLSKQLIINVCVCV